MRKLHFCKRTRHLTVESLEGRMMLTGFLVNTLVDDPGATAGDTDGYVSLREAITAANTNAPFGDATAGQGSGTVDTISFDASLTGQTIVLGGAELTVSDDLALTGLGATDLTISGDHASRALSIDAGVTVDISKVTIADGAEDTGGGIYNEGTLALTSSILTRNHADFIGGAIWSNGELDIADSVLSDNSSDFGGGGIYSVGALAVANGRFLDNWTVGHGGGIAHRGTTLTIVGSTFSGNSAHGDGGAIDLWSNGLTFITDTTISNNSARYGGAIDNVFSALTVTNSTISGNSVDRDGGAIYSLLGITHLSNSTLSGNVSNGRGGGIWNLGTLEITNSTLTGNRADADGDQYGNGGGLYDSSSAVLDNTIVAGNLRGPAGSLNPDDISGTVDPASSHNLIGDSTTAGGLTHGAGGNLVGNAGSGTIDIATVLDTNLADNGGPTRTHALVPGGVAANAGNNSDAVDADGNTLAYDQRGAGFGRIVDGTVDIGALEAQPQVVQIDVKPGSDPNSINLASQGVISVAIFTTADFDAANVNVSTLIWAGANVAQKNDGSFMSALEDVDGDGDLDLVVHFRLAETNLLDVYEDLLRDDLTDGSLDSYRQSVDIALEGLTNDGVSFRGSDTVDLFLTGKNLRDFRNQRGI